MKKVLKTLIACILTLIIAISNVPFNILAAEEAVYLPVRQTFTLMDLTTDIHWDPAFSRVTITYGDQIIELDINSTTAYWSGDATDLTFPIIIDNERAMISYFDIAHLFIDENSGFDSTIMTAIATAISLMDQISVPGLAMAVVERDEGFTWTMGLGTYNTQNATAQVDENTAFALGSIAKTFTAIAIMQLVEEGLLDLDTPIVEYLSDFRIYPQPLTEGADYNNITARMLLNHTSGIMPNFLGYNSLTIGGFYEDFFNNFLDILANYPLVTKEGTVFTYNNNGYVLLGHLIVELASGSDSPFFDFSNNALANIFEPLGLYNTSYILDDVMTASIAMSYFDANTPVDQVFMSSLPTGSMWSTANDMATIMHALLADDGKLLAPDGIRAMTVPADFDFSATLGGMSYGFGFLTAPTMDGFNLVGHSGSIINHNAAMFIDLDSGIGVFVAVNSAAGVALPTVLAQAILQTAIHERTGSINIAIETRQDPHAIQIELDQSILENYVGVYQGELEYFIIDMGDTGNLYMIIPTLTELPPLELTPMSDGSFLSLIGPVWFDNVEIGDEDIIALRQGALGHHAIALQIDMEYVRATEDFINNWVGTFVAQPSTAYELSIISELTFDVDSHGIAYQRASQIQGLAPVAAVLQFEEAKYFGITDIVTNEDGLVVSFIMVGMNFMRAN